MDKKDVILFGTIVERVCSHCLGVFPKYYDCRVCQGTGLITTDEGKAMVQFLSTKLYAQRDGLVIDRDESRYDREPYEG